MPTYRAGGSKYCDMVLYPKFHVGSIKNGGIGYVKKNLIYKG